MNSSSDTIVFDLSRIQAIIDEGGHDYYSQKFVVEYDSVESTDSLEYKLPEPSTTTFSLNSAYILTFIGILLFTFFIFAIYKQGLFRSNAKSQDAKEEEEEDGDLQIEGIDFESELKEAEASGNWDEALRLSYLYTLRHLSDAGLVEWKHHKTPTDYSIEAGNIHFNHLTNLFLRSHYGMYATGEEEFREAYRLYQQIKEGGGA